MSVNQRSKLPGNAVTVRGLSPELKVRLRVRAAHNARSMEAEARAILEAALSAPDDESTDLGAFARGLFAPLGGTDLELPSRSPPRHPPQLGGAAEVPAETDEPPAVGAPAVSEEVAEASSEAAQAATLPKGRRRNSLGQAVARLLGEGLGGSILPFDRAAAAAYGELAPKRQAAGGAVTTAVGQIAAIVKARGARLVATRDVAGYVAQGMKCVDPWSS